MLKEGGVACFRAARRGRIQIINRTDSPVRVLMLSSMIRGEVIEYLDTGKVLAKDVEDEDIMFAGPDPRPSTGKARTSSGRRLDQPGGRKLRSGERSSSARASCRWSQSGLKTTLWSRSRARTGWSSTKSGLRLRSPSAGGFSDTSGKLIEEGTMYDVQTKRTGGQAYDWPWPFRTPLRYP